MTYVIWKGAQRLKGIRLQELPINSNGVYSILPILKASQDHYLRFKSYEEANSFLNLQREALETQRARYDAVVPNGFGHVEEAFDRLFIGPDLIKR